MVTTILLIVFSDSWWFLLLMSPGLRVTLQMNSILSARGRWHCRFWLIVMMDGYVERNTIHMISKDIYTALSK